MLLQYLRFSCITRALLYDTGYLFKLNHISVNLLINFPLLTEKKFENPSIKSIPIVMILAYMTALLTLVRIGMIHENNLSKMLTDKLQYCLTIYSNTLDRSLYIKE